MGAVPYTNEEQAYADATRNLDQETIQSIRNNPMVAPDDPPLIAHAKRCYSALVAGVSFEGGTVHYPV